MLPTRGTITDTSEVTDMKNYFEKLRTLVAENPPDFGDSDSVLAFLYEAYNETHNMDDAQTKADFRTLYQAMNGMTLQEMDTITDPVCALCRDHQRSGFIEGIRIGIRLREELTEK